MPQLARARLPGVGANLEHNSSETAPFLGGGSSSRLEPELQPLLAMKLEALQLEARVPVDLVPSSFRPEHEGVHPVDVGGPPELLGRLASLGVRTPTTLLSPLSPVNIPREELVKVKIPLGTKYFAFLYPLPASAHAALDDHSPMEALMINGGFVYFEGVQRGVCRVLGINVICPEGSAGILNFEGPHELGREARRELQEQGRMQCVTMPFLLRFSAESFAWIHPGEFGEGLGPVAAEYGAFAYTSANGDGIYFPMKIAQKQNSARRKSSFERKRGLSTPSSTAASFLRGRTGEDSPRERRRGLHTALWMASDDGDAETCSRALLEGAEVNEQDEDGHTALSRAAEGGHTSLVQMLVTRHGADVWQRNKDGKTATEAAFKMAIDHGAHGHQGNTACFEAATAMLAAAFRTAPGPALIDAVKIASEARRHAKRQKQRDAERCDDLHVASQMAQLTAAGLLRALDERMLAHLLDEYSGRVAMREAVLHDCKLLLGDTGVQLLLTRRWRGLLLEQLNTGEARTPLGSHEPLGIHWWWQASLLVVLLPLNLLLLPLVTMVPQLEAVIVGGLRRLGSYKKHSKNEREGYSEHGRFYWGSFFLLNVPLLKFILASLFSLGLACALTALPPALEGEPVPPAYPPLLGWCLACGLIELLHLLLLAEHRAAWRVGPLGLMHTLGLTLASVSLLADCSDAGDSPLGMDGDSRRSRTQGARSVAVMLLWASQGLHVVKMLPSLGPLVLMLFKMGRDVMEWLLLVAVLLFAFSASLFVVFKGARARLSSSDGCNEYVSEMGSWLPHDLLLLYQELLGGDTSFDCLEDSGHWLSATALMGVYLMLSVVLLMNMLIAQMSKTFDVVWEAQALNYSYIFAAMVLQWEALPPAPPPLALLGLPAALLRRVRSAASVRRQSKKKAFDPSANREWAEQYPLSELGKSVEEYVMSRQDDAGEEERWRSKLNRRIGRLETNLEVRIDELAGVLSKLSDELLESRQVPRGP